MITSGFALACLTTGAFWLIYNKLPRKVRKFLQKHALLTDVMACLTTYMIFGSSLVALFAAAFTGIITSLLLAIVNDPRGAALLSSLGEKANTIKEKFVNIIISLGPNAIETNQPQLKIVEG